MALGLGLLVSGLLVPSFKASVSSLGTASGLQEADPRASRSFEREATEVSHPREGLAAQVGATKIREETLRAALRPAVVHSFLESEAARAATLEGLIEAELLRAYAAHAGLEVTPAALEARATHLRAVWGLNAERASSLAKEELLLEQMMAHERIAVEPTPEEITANYLQTQSAFKVKARVRFEMVTVAPRSRETKTDELHHQEAIALKRRLESRKSIDAHVKQRSEYLLMKEQIEPGLREQAFDAEVGSVIGPLANRDGFSLAVIKAHRPEGYKSLDEVHEIVYERAKKEKRRLGREALLQKARETIPVQNFDSAWNRQWSRLLSLARSSHLKSEP